MMTYRVTGKWMSQPAVSALLRYGLPFASIAVALGIARIFLYFHLPQPFTAFALSAIAITFWYGGTKPGILAAALASIVRNYHWSEVSVASRALYDLVFLVFALLMMGVNRARGELEVRVAQRTAELTQANDDLSLEIAERKRAEDKLRQSEAYLAEAQRLSHTGSWARTSPTGEMRYWSEECYRVLGFDPHDGPPRFETFLQRVHADDRTEVREISAAAGREKVDYETDYRIVHPGGEIRDIHVLAHPVFNPSGDLIEYVGTVMDVTERKRAEGKLRQSEAYLAEAQKLTHTGSWVWEVAGRCASHLSEEWYRIYGFDPKEGLPVWDKRLQRIHPDDRAKWQEVIDRAIREKSDYEVEFRILLPGGTVKHLRTVGHPVLNGFGDLVQFVGSSSDITDRRQAEEALRRTQSDLARVSRVTTMGELTASLAHEVNQPIAAAVTDANTCLRWLTRDQPDVEEARQAASRVVKDATRAAEIISRVRSLFRKETPQRELVDMNEVIKEMVVLLHNEASRYSIAVRSGLGENLPAVLGDRVQLQQVLMNLMINSIDAMKEIDGTRELIINAQPTENDHVSVSVSDTGVGLPQQQEAKQIFNAFFTTKPKGTGMGLRISQSIIESHGGRLWAAANSPRGASFYFTLPTKEESD
jgi:PAS domain S-box-containing protein